MKKLCLLLMMMVASWAAVAQENSTIAGQGEMVRKRSKLCFLNGTEKVVIPETDLMQLLDEKAYDSYCGGRKFFKIGTGLVWGGGAAIGTGVGVAVLGVHYMRNGEVVVGEPDDTFDRGGRMLVYGVAIATEGIGLIVAGSIFRRIAAGKISRIAEEYNQNNQNTAISYRLSPSIMPVNVPQSQSNVAYGMTFSVNF